MDEQSIVIVQIVYAIVTSIYMGEILNVIWN